MNEREEALDFLARLGSHPAVAYHEAGVASEVRAILDETGVGYSVDEFGNILARLPGRDADVPGLAIVAHMDHPGFELTERLGDSADEFVADALGGIPASSFAAGVPLRVMLPDGRRVAAETAGPHGEESERKAVVRVSDTAASAEMPLPAATVFDLTDFELDGEYIRMRAVDDLAGCASALAAMARLSRGWRTNGWGRLRAVHAGRGSGTGGGAAVRGCAPAAGGYADCVGGVESNAAGGRAGARAGHSRGGTRGRRSMRTRNRC